MLGIGRSYALFVVYPAILLPLIVNFRAYGERELIARSSS
jgi:hypothetical protein